MKTQSPFPMPSTETNANMVSPSSSENSKASRLSNHKFASSEVTAEANGRVNLIGEHTDYNGGWVLPTAIPQKTTVHLRTREDKRVQATSHFCQPSKEPKEASYFLGQEMKVGTWVDYLQGVTHVLQSEGHPLRGFEIHIESTVPIGSGLSSSAALEISFLKALKTAFNLPLNEKQMARIGQRAENEFVGARVGIMDQMACGLAQKGQALFLDTLTLNYEQVTLDFSKVDLVVINSGLSHQNSDGGYNQRRSECEEACQLLKISSLRELKSTDLHRLEILPETLKRRARHVITENDRVHEAVKAIHAEDFARLGELFYESHASMRDDYQVSIPAIDLLVKIASENSRVYGARLTGGGFGGSIVALTHPGHGREVAENIQNEYQRLTPHRATILVPS